MNEFKLVTGSISPIPVEIGKKNVFIRKDIEQKTEVGEDGNTTTYYQYLERKVSLRDYLQEVLPPLVGR